MTDHRRPICVRPALAAAALAVVAGLATPVGAIVYRDDMTEAQSRGLAAQDQFKATGIVTGVNGSGSAALILPDWIITAKHVVGGDANGTANATFFLGGGSYAGKVYSNPANDFALVHLTSGSVPASAATPIAPGFFGDEAGKLVWLAGYGGYKSVSESTVNTDWRLRAGTNVVREYSSPYLYFDNANTNATSTAYESSTAPGDSGGPMYRQVDNVWYVVGETFGASSNGFTHTPTNPNKTFILNTIRAVSGNASFNFPTPGVGPTSLTWDSNVTVDGTSDGGGTWDVQRTNFRSPATGFNYQWENGLANDVTFGNGSGAAGTVTIAATNLVSGTLIGGGAGPKLVEAGVTAHNVTFNAAGSGSYTIAGTAPLTLAASAYAAGDPTLRANVDATIGAPIAGTTATIAKAGNGELTLSGANTFGGKLLVNAGTLRATRAAALPNYATADQVRVANGATLAVNVGGASDWTSAQLDGLASAATFANGSTLAVDTANGGFTHASALAMNAGLTKLGANTFTSDAANTYAGPTRVQAGTLKFTDAAGLPATSAATVASGATLELDARNTVAVASPITISGSGAAGSRGALYFNSGNVATYNLSGGITLAGDATIGSFAVNHTLNVNAGITGTGSLAFNNEGGSLNVHSFTVHFNAASDYAGDTRLTSGNGNKATYRLGVDNALPTSTRLTLAPASGTLAFQLNGRNQTVAGLATAGVAANASISGAAGNVLTVDAATDFHFGGAIINGAGLTKRGVGTQTLSGANTYTGATRVEAGTLSVTGSLGNTAVTVAANGALAGTGSVAGATTSDGLIAPGDDGVGTLSLNGGLTLGSGSGLSFDLGASDRDLLSTVALALGANVNVAVNAGDGFGVGVYSLIDYASVAGAANLTSWTVTGVSSAYSYRFLLGTDAKTGSAAVQLDVMTVPEPTAMLAMAGVIVAGVARRRR